MEVDREVEDTAAEIVADLDHRIRRLEFYLTGALDVEDVPRDEAKLKPDLRARLKNIEESIGGIASERRALNDMLRLYLEYPELFPTDTLIPSDMSGVDDKDTGDTSLDEQLTTVNACATMFPALVSRLNLLKDSPVPPSEATASILSIKPRLDRAESVQDSLAADVSQLRLRSILLLQRWVKVGVQAAGHCWADWEERLLEVERTVRRAEVAQAQDEQA